MFPHGIQFGKNRIYREKSNRLPAPVPWPFILLAEQSTAPPPPVLRVTSTYIVCQEGCRCGLQEPQLWFTPEKLCLVIHSCWRS